MKELHIGLWGDDNFKIYTPLIALQRQVTLLVLGPTETKHEILASLSGRYGNLEFLPWDGGATEECYSRLSEAVLSLKADDVFLNLSSGDRLGVIKLFQWAQKEDIKTYLIDDDDRQHWLHPAGKSVNEVNELASLKEYFRVHQIKLLSHGMGLPITDGLKRMVEQWVLELGALDPYRYLNKLASSAKPQGNISVEQKFSVSMNQEWDRSSISGLLKDLAEQGLLDCHGRTLTFLNEQARFFCNGGWLELFVYQQLCELKQKLCELQDVRLGLEVLYPEQVKNELDVVFLANNQLYIVEVKTAFLSDNTSAANQLVYKLEALSEALGKEVKGMVVSLSDFPGPSKRRADLYEIEVVSGSGVKSLKSRLKSWIAN